MPSKEAIDQTPNEIKINDDLDLSRSNNSNQENSQAFKRKRGRPRKNQIMEKAIDKKKRGRKPRERSFGNNGLDHDQDDDDEDDEIILNLKITMSEVNEINGDQENTEQPADAYEGEGEGEGEENDDTNESRKASPLQDTNIFTIADISSDETSSDGQFTDPEHIGSGILSKLKEQDELISRLQKELLDYKNMVSDNIISGLNDSRVSLMKTKFVDIKDGKMVIIEKTNIACWWCSEHFSTMPCFIPEKYVDDKYYVFGCFCSFNCSAAYNVSMNDYKVWDRHSLIKKLYNTLFNTIDDVYPAPPREALTKFGGILNIEEFRKTTLKGDKEYRFIMPPMISIVPFIEEGHRSNGSDGTGGKKKGGGKPVPKDDELVLKRTKPLPNENNTLLETMGLIRGKRRTK